MNDGCGLWVVGPVDCVGVDVGIVDCRGRGFVGILEHTI